MLPLTAFSVGKALEIKITGPSTDVGIESGSNVVLNCSVLPGLVYELSWWKGNISIRSTYKTLQTAQGQMVFSSIFLTSVTPGNATGVYTCEAKNGNRSRQATFSLHVDEKPRIILNPKRKTWRLTEGDTFSVTCIGTGWPHPALNWWYKAPNMKCVILGGEYVERTSAGDRIKLKIPSIAPRYSGVYTCSGLNRAGKAAYRVLVGVRAIHKYHPPVVTSQQHRVTGYLGTNITLGCKCTGVPKSTTAISWYLNGRKLSLSSKYKIRSDYTSATEATFFLDLLNLTARNEGIYTCHVTNSVGTGNDTMMLKVQTQVPFQISALDTEVRGHLFGPPVELVCIAKYPSHEGRPTTFWSLNSTQINSTSRSRHNEIKTIHKKADYNQMRIILTISKINKQDFGRYTCGLVTPMGRLEAWVLLRRESVAQDQESDAPSHRPFWKTPLILSMTVMLLMAMTGISVAYVVKSRRRRRTFDLMKDKDINGLINLDFKYDIFVTYSAKDFKWVKEKLIPILEKNNFTYCIHNRDFEIGKAIVDNMADSVYKSRQVIAVISENYMASKFCRAELDMALCRSTEMADSSLLTIRLNGIKKNKLPKGLREKTFLDCVERGEGDEWQERLFSHLKPSSCPRMPVVRK